MILLVKLFAVSLTWIFVQSNSQRDKLFLFQKSSGEGNQTLLVVTWKSEDETSIGCEFFTDKELIKEVLQSSTDITIRTLSEDDMQNVLDECTEFNLKRRKRGIISRERPTISSDDILNDHDELFRRRSSRRRNRVRVGENREVEGESNETETITESPTTPGYDGRPIIFPGTKWCGAGDVAANYEDLGRYNETDECCRAHDLCNDTLAPGETRYNLTNESEFTALSCQCDDDFYNCLERVDSVASNAIGNMYFNILRRRCYKLDYPVTNVCKKYRSFLKLGCSEYQQDTESEKTYQWSTAQKYKKIPLPGPLSITIPF